MTLPERGTPEFATFANRIHRRIVDAVHKVALRRKDLPPEVFVFIHDETTGERFGSCVGVKYIGDSGVFLTRTSINQMAPGVTVMDAADMLLELSPGTPLICDTKIADELFEGSTPWIEGGHYRLAGRPKGVLEVYTPYQTENLPKSELPPGVANAWVFQE